MAEGKSLWQALREEAIGKSDRFERQRSAVVRREGWFPDPNDPDVSTRWDGQAWTTESRTDLRCLFSMGLYERVTFLADLPDGTCTIARDAASMPAPFNRMYGVPKSRLLFRQFARWGEIFDELRGDRPGLDEEAFKQAMLRCNHVGPQVVEAVDQLYRHFCRQVFQWEDGQPVDVLLDRRQSYDLLVGGGLAPSGGTIPPAPFHERYWGMMGATFRVGGRDPAELPRAITRDDAAAALGLPAQPPKPGWTERKRSKAIEEFGVEHGVSIPAELAWLWSVAVEKALKRVFPYRGEFITPGSHEAPGSEDWPVIRNDEDSTGEVTIPFMHIDGAVWWSVVLREGSHDFHVAVTSGDSGASYVAAPNLSMFVWDIVQSSLAPYVDEGRAAIGRPSGPSDSADRRWPAGGLTVVALG